MSVTEFDTTARASTWREPRTLLACGTLALALALTACGGSAKPSQNKGPGSGGTPAATGTSTTTSSAATSGSAAGGGSTGTSAGGDYCSLVTRDEAQAVLGRAVQPGLSRSGTTPAGVSGSCIYNDANPVVGKPAVVNVIVLGTKIPRSVYDQELKGDPDAPDIKPLSGLGEDAFFIPGVVTVFDHGLVLSLEIIKDGVPVDTATITDLLRTALGRAGNLG
ncbi:MAG TPA: hypothetical protein VIM17_08215 [Jatrophihabitantaceae bacterium]